MVILKGAPQHYVHSARNSVALNICIDNQLCQASYVNDQVSTDDQQVFSSGIHSIHSISLDHFDPLLRNHYSTRVDSSLTLLPEPVTVFCLGHRCYYELVPGESLLRTSRINTSKCATIPAFIKCTCFLSSAIAWQCYFAVVVYAKNSNTGI